MPTQTNSNSWTRRGCIFREWDVVRARVFWVFFICFVFFCHLPHTFSVIFIKFIGFVSWYYLGIQLDSWCQLVLHVYIYICILKYRYYLGIQLLQRRCIYIYMYIALGICIGGFCYWTARSPFGWHDSSSGTLLAYESANSNLLSLLK